MFNFIGNPQLFDTISAMHATGFQFGKTIVMYGAGFSIGKNIIRIIRGSVRGAVAFSNVIRDTIIFFVISYLAGSLGSGAVRMATVATGTNISVDTGAATAGMTQGAVGESAVALSGAAGELVERVTSGLFGMMGSAGGNVGDTLTMATSGTAAGGAVAGFVGALNSIGSATGSLTLSIISSVLFGALIGAFVALIFDK